MPHSFLSFSSSINFAFSSVGFILQLFSLWWQRWPQEAPGMFCPHRQGARRKWAILLSLSIPISPSAWIGISPDGIKCPPHPTQVGRRKKLSLSTEIMWPSCEGEWGGITGEAIQKRQKCWTDWSAAGRGRSPQAVESTVFRFLASSLSPIHSAAFLKVRFMSGTVGGTARQWPWAQWFLRIPYLVVAVHRDPHAPPKRTGAQLRLERLFPFPHIRSTSQYWLNN